MGDVLSADGVRDRTEGAAPCRQPAHGMVWIPGAAFTMGSDHHYAEEAPAHRVAIGGFWMDRHTVTNDAFRQFIDQTGYVTLAERVPDAADYPDAKPELLVPASVVFQQPPGPVDKGDCYQWWTYVPGAHWRRPGGPGSNIRNKGRHPVVHVAYQDALAYATWAGKELPTEAEWEFAARGGLDGAEFAWGDAFTPDGKYMANTWQGDFPHQNLGTDGYDATAPSGSFPANGYGLYDMIGNVWEWTQDWYQEHNRVQKTCCTIDNPRGGEREASLDPRLPAVKIPRRVTKGGSYLCAPNYCRRYRPAARMAQPVDTSTCHLGFRCIVRTPIVEG